jgi:hypothetical protein
MVSRVAFSVPIKVSAGHAAGIGALPPDALAKVELHVMSRFEPVLMVAPATGERLLLIEPHGPAKTLH